MTKPETQHKETEVYYYQGPLTFDRITIILSEFEKALLGFHIETKRFKRLFSTTVEMLENIQMHGMVYNQKNYPYFRVLYKDGIFTLEAANLMESAHVHSLKEKIDALNNEFPSLRELFKGPLMNNELSIKGGAGLGLYIIRRNILGDISYKIEPYIGGISVFVLKVFL